jgi:hypothetical protein
VCAAADNSPAFALARLAALPLTGARTKAALRGRARRRRARRAHAFSARLQLSRYPAAFGQSRPATVQQGHCTCPPRLDPTAAQPVVSCSCRAAAERPRRATATGDDGRAPPVARARRRLAPLASATRPRERTVLPSPCTRRSCRRAGHHSRRRAPRRPLTSVTGDAQPPRRAARAPTLRRRGSGRVDR